ncbi:MAG: protoporphyrinogen oxidase [Acidimicrobiia bacterium]|nr:protoporphyrinogen oxidase [Acidimicrobiia bacterium]
MNDVIVVGGGLGGLIVGAELKRRGKDVLVLEATAEAAGVAASVREDGYILEPGAGSLLWPNDDLGPIFDSAGIEMLPANAEAKARFVYERGTLYEIPESPAIAFSGLISWGAKFRAVREPWIKTPSPSEEESIEGFFTRRFGRELGVLGSTLMSHGVFAGDPAKLSMRGAFPKMVALEDEANSLIRGMLARMKQREKGKPRASVHVPPRGMKGVAEDLVAYLGDSFKAHQEVGSVKQAETGWSVVADGEFEAKDVVLALAPHAARKLVPADVANLMIDAVVEPVAVVGIGGRAADVPIPAGFGALIGPNNDVRVLGILMESQYAPGRAPDLHHLAKGIYGGGADPEVLMRTDDELISLMVEETSRVIGTRVQPSWTRVVRHNPGIPQYNVGHVGWMRKLDAAITNYPGLYLTGWGYRGIGVSGMGTEAVRIGDQIGA